MTCLECGLPMHYDGQGEYTTLVGYLPRSLAQGHSHDDNCLTRMYVCPQGHYLRVSKRRTCPAPGCDWKGKDWCFCHPGKKVEEWP